MENNSTDNDIRLFFTDKKQEIQDNGFSDKVMSNLPKVESSREWLVILFAVLGGIVALFFAIYNGSLLKCAELFSMNAEGIVMLSSIVPVILAIILLIIDRQRASRFPF